MRTVRPTILESPLYPDTFLLSEPWEHMQLRLFKIVIPNIRLLQTTKATSREDLSLEQLPEVKNSDDDHRIEIAWACLQPDPIACCIPGCMESTCHGIYVADLPFLLLALCCNLERHSYEAPSTRFAFNFNITYQELSVYRCRWQMESVKHFQRSNAEQK